MAKVLVTKEAAWYNMLRAVSYYGESDLERFIKQHLALIFPDFYVFPFKMDVVSRVSSKTKKPDMAMVRRDFKAWGVIEVELIGHSLDHVLEQVRVFLDGDYNAPQVAEYVQKQMQRFCQKNVSLTRLGKLLTTQAPMVLVVADAMSDEWKAELEAVNADLCIFEVYKNGRGSHIFRTWGEYPLISEQQTACRRHPSLPNMLELIGRLTFPSRKRAGLSIAYEGQLTRWSLLTDRGKQYLQFTGKVNPLDPNQSYTLHRHKSGTYAFK